MTHRSSQLSTLVLGSLQRGSVALHFAASITLTLVLAQKTGAASPVGSLDVDRNTSGLSVNHNSQHFKGSYWQKKNF